MVAVQLVAPEPRHDAVVGHFLVEVDGLHVVLHAEQQEVGVGVVDPHDDVGEGFQLLSHARPFLQRAGDVFAQRVHRVHGVDRHLARQGVDVVGCLHVVHQLDDVGRTDAEAAPDAGESERLGQRLQDHDVVVFFEQGDGRGVFAGEVDVGLVDDDQTGVLVRVGGDLFDVGQRDRLAGRITGTADKQQLRLFGHCFHHLRDIQIELRRQRRRYDGDVVDLGADLVHPVGRRRGQDVVPVSGATTGRAENPHQQVDGLVGSDPDEDVGRFEVVPAFPAEQLLQIGLVGIGIPLEGVGVVVGVQGLGRQGGRTEGVFVGVQQDAVGVVVAGATVGLQLEDVRASQLRGDSGIGCHVAVIVFFCERGRDVRSSREQG
mmetsp:Transcript_2075/g.5490  ORF Transcript_2075/g.5490 Transcript_2075/m.5490 type:complete len:375 (+) Transcript_2075:1762-2886(+)